MHVTGISGFLAAALLAFALAAAPSSGDARAQETIPAAPDTSWDPVEAEHVQNRPDQPLPKEAEPPPAPRGWAPPDLVAPKPSMPDASPSAPGAEEPPAAAETPDTPMPAAPGSAPVGVCDKADFEAVVDDAAGALRDLNMQNKPAFQEKLRQLKDKRGWSHDEFLQAAAPFVRDTKIAVYDQESEHLLTDISTLGQEGADAATPDCALLADLKARMQKLVDTQTAKWSYMFQKLDAALKQ